MTKSLKKLLCGFIAASMLTVAASVGFADADSVDTEEEVIEEIVEDVTATEETEATATPEPTAAPVPTDSYSADAYYNRALALCKALGIITGYDDGSVQPEAIVTRAEMAAIVLRALNETAGAAYTNVFTDVDASHWAATTIQTAYDKTIINGMGDGTFAPDGGVTAAQVQKMLVCAANFGELAEINGGWDGGGYLKIANENMDLIKGVKYENVNAGCKRGEVIKMVYNALMAPYGEITGTSAGQPVYTSGRTWAKVKFNLVEKKGILAATSTTSIAGITPKEGQVIIDGDTYECTITGIDSLVGSQIYYYYTETTQDGITVLAIAKDEAKTTSVDINVDDIEKFSGFAEYKGEIKLYGSTKKYQMSDSAQIVYNGKTATPNEYSGDFDELLEPECGTIRLVDNDTDGKYDIMYVDSYETMIVSSATAKSVIGNIGSYDDAGNAVVTKKTVNVEEQLDKVVKVTKDEMEVKPRNLRKDDVVSLKMSLDGMNIEMIVTGESITGSVKAVGSEDNVKTATINGDVYKVAAIAADDAKLGAEGTFYLDAFGRVAYIDSTSGGLSGSEKYGWIMKGYESDTGDGYTIDIYSQDGTVVSATPASSMKYWAPAGTSEESLSRTEAENTLRSLVTGGSFTKASSGEQIRLVKYKVNSQNLLSSLYCAVSKANVSDTDALIVDATNLKNTVSMGSMLSGYYVKDGMARFIVPSVVEDMGSASNYTFDTATASTYLNSEDGVNRDFIFGNLGDSKTPGIVVEFTASADGAAVIGDYNNASNNPTFVYENMGVGIDADENTIYTFMGYSGGSQVQYTTNKNTLFAKVGDSKVFSSKTEYNGAELWNAVDMATPITDHVTEGDVIGYSGDGRVFLKMVDVEELAKYVLTGSGKQYIGYESASSTRDGIAVGSVTVAELEDAAMLTAGGLSVNFDPGRVLDVVNITYSGKTVIDIEYDQDEYTIADVLTESDAADMGMIGDYAFIRKAKPGLQDVVIFKFIEE